MGPKLLRPFGTARVPGRRAGLGDVYMRQCLARGACLSRSGALRKALGPCCRRAKQGNTLQIMWAQSFCGRFGLRAFRGGAQGLGMCICGGVRLAARASAGRGRFQSFEFMTVRPTDRQYADNRAAPESDNSISAYRLSFVIFPFDCLTICCLILFQSHISATASATEELSVIHIPSDEFSTV